MASPCPGNSPSLRITSSPPLSHPVPVLPILGHVHEDRAHDSGTGHQAVALAFEDSHLTALHCLAKPLHVLNRDTSIAGSMVNNNRPGYINIAEADGMSAFQANQEINRRVRSGSGQLPYSMSQPRIIRHLPLLIRQSICCSSQDASFLTSVSIGASVGAGLVVVAFTGSATNARGLAGGSALRCCGSDGRCTRCRAGSFGSNTIHLLRGNHALGQLGHVRGLSATMVLLIVHSTGRGPTVALRTRGITVTAGCIALSLPSARRLW